MAIFLTLSFDLTLRVLGEAELATSRPGGSLLGTGRQGKRHHTHGAAIVVCNGLGKLNLATPLFYTPLHVIALTSTQTGNPT